MRVRTSDGQEFDAWVNSPENDRKVPAWLGQVGGVTDERTTITAPDGSSLTIAANAIVVNEHGRLHSFDERQARRLFDVIEGEDEMPSGPQAISVPAQSLPVGRARQGMATSDRGRLQPDDPLAGLDPPARDADTRTSQGDSGAAGSEQNGESAGEPASSSGPAEATASGGPGGDGDDPAFGAIGGAGDDPAAEDSGGVGADEEDAIVTSRSKRGKK